MDDNNKLFFVQTNGDWQRVSRNLMLSTAFRANAIIQRLSDGTYIWAKSRYWPNGTTVDSEEMAMIILKAS